MDADEQKDKKEAFNIYQYDAELALAFQLDCDQFLEKFSKLTSLTFSAFAETWKETNFIAIFEGHEFILMIKTFIENCFSIIKKFLFLKDPYKQVGALYLLYSIYYKQPIKRWVKIRITENEARQLSEIVETNKNQSWDLLFIYNKMRIDGAFHYCAIPQPLGLHATVLKRYDLTNEEIIDHDLEENALKKFKSLIEEESAISELENTDQEYQSLVAKYKERCKKLYVFPSDVSSELRRAYNNVFDKNSPGEEQDRARLKEVVSRAMSNKRAIYRAERSAMLLADVADKIKASSSK